MSDEEIDFDDLDVAQFAFAVREEGGRERHMKDVARMLNAPMYIIADFRDVDLPIGPQ